LNALVLILKHVAVVRPQFMASCSYPMTKNECS